MKRKLCVLLLGLCLVSVSACGEKAVSGRSDDIPVSSNDEKAKEASGDNSMSETFNNEDDYVMSGTVDAPDESDAQPSTEEETSEAASEEVKNEDEGTNEELVDGMHPEFKEAMDSYEAFFDKYCDTIKKYNENPSDLKLIADYTDILAKSVEASEKFEAWDEDEMNDAELKYYLEVESRVAQKLLEVSQ